MASTETGTTIAQVLEIVDAAVALRRTVPVGWKGNMRPEFERLVRAVDAYVAVTP